MSSNANLIVFVYTGNRKYAGTDGTVHIILHGEDGTATKPIILSNFFSDNFEKDKIDVFSLSPQDVEKLDRFVKIERLELWKDRTLGILSDDWFVEKIVVENRASSATFIFPVLRWVNSTRRYHFKHLDTSLPQFDAFPEQRKMELKEKRKLYQYEEKVPGGVQIKTMPPDEQYSSDYKWNMVKKKTYLSFIKTFTKLRAPKIWTRLSDIDSIYDEKVFYKPSGTYRWDCDIEFGRQRIASINPSIITLLTTIPEKFPVTDDLLKPLLEGLTIKDAMTKKRLFLCDLNILEGIPIKPNMTLCKPFALFFVDNKQRLRPVAIQLFQEPGPDNPVFTPLDDPMLWKFVKMWYNNADSCQHLALTHLGLTHLMMEGIAINNHRNLSPSHPVFKLLAPHFLYLIMINSKALPFLMAPGEWGDKIITLGHKGLLALTVKGLDKWRMNVEGLLPEELKKRGLDDPSVLPGYHYRNDGLLIFDAIKKYVTSYVNLYYTSADMIKNDAEIQAWAQELVKKRNNSQGGVGMKGVPGNGSLDSSEDLVNIITSIIFTCSVAHASANFGQYDEYGAILRYPPLLKGKPPSSKDLQVTDKSILNSLGNRDQAQDILYLMYVLSSKGTNSIGDFEVQYIFDPRATEFVKEFREDLKKITATITARNEQLDVPYENLLPAQIPNSISI